MLKRRHVERRLHQGWQQDLQAGQPECAAAGAHARAARIALKSFSLFINTQAAIVVFLIVLLFSPTIRFTMRASKTAERNQIKVLFLPGTLLKSAALLFCK